MNRNHFEEAIVNQYFKKKKSKYLFGLHAEEIGTYKN
jgi:hypothetical protein